MIYDVIVIGSGPAGLAAAIYAKRAELSLLVIEKAALSGGQVINTYEVDNYPGIPGIGGFELSMKFREHADKLGADFVTGEVIDFALDNEIKVVTLDSGDIFRTKSVVIATGGAPRHLNVPGEAELSGMGVSYCATCDGAFFKNKTVAVVGGGDTAIEDAIFLARICKQVYIVHRRDQFRANKSVVTKLMELENVTVLWDSKVEKISGEDKVSAFEVKNIKTEHVTSYELDGIFIAIGYNPNSDPYKKVVAADEAGYIIAGENCETNIPGIYAAGDVRTKDLRQIITATADGANAITAVEKYLNQL